MKKYVVAVLTAVLFSSSAAAQDFGRDVDAFVQQVMAATGATGLGIAVVKDDAPVLLKGYGLADVERRVPVTPTTQYYIASTTKAFTALTLALMARRGQVDLDAPITRYLHDVRWAPGVAADSVTLRHLLSHTHGIANSGPVVWRTAFTGEHTNAQLKGLLQYHGPNEKGRSFEYTNLGYNIAGLLIDDVTGKRWQDVLEQTVMKPAGMLNTTAYISRFDSAQLAMPYSLEPNGIKRLYYAKRDANMQAAGGLVSNAADLARWLEIQINRGKLDGKQVFPADVIAETQRIQAPVSGGSGAYRALGYSLGWNVGELYGDTVYQHGGGFSTFRTLIAFSPKQKVGLAVMATQSHVGGLAVDVISDFAFERALNPQWRAQAESLLQALPARVQRARDAVAADRARRAQRPQDLPRPLTAYTGSFEHLLRGSMLWTVRDGHLWVQMGALQSVAEVFNASENKLRAEPEPGSGEIFTFNFEDNRAVSVVYSGATYRRVR